MHHPKRRHPFPPTNLFSMVLPNGQVHHSPVDLQAPILSRNPMARYAAQLVIRLPPTSVDLSAMARYGSSTAHALCIAAPVLFGHSVKKPRPRVNRDK